MGVQPQFNNAPFKVSLSRMSTRDLTRSVLGCLTTLIMILIAMWGGKIESDCMYLTIVGSLIIIVILSLDNCRLVSPSIEAFETGIDMLSSIPQKFLDKITPSLDRVVSVVRGDRGSQDTSTTDLSTTAYKDDVSLHMTDGSAKVDSILLDKMKLEYKRIVVLLCRMKYMAPESHDLLVTAMSCQTPVVRNVV